MFAAVSRMPPRAEAAVMSSISRRDQNLISGSRMETCTFRGGAMSARTTMKIAFVMEMADDGVTDVPSADALDGLTDGTGRRERRIMCHKSQRRAEANRSKKERGGSFCLSNFQWAERARERIYLICSVCIRYRVCVHARAGPRSPLFCSPWVTHWQSRGMPLGGISKGGVAGGIE